MSAHDLRLQLEAAAYLVAARLAVRAVPFRRLTRLLERAPRRPELHDPARAAVRAEVRRAIYSASRHLPGKTVCFPQAVAAQAMLRRRGVSTVVYYGARRPPEGGLAAHVWLQDGDVGVTGKRVSGGYHPLARYPPAAMEG